MHVWKCSARGSLEIRDAKYRHFGTITQICWAISSQLRHLSTIGKKLVKQQYLPKMSLQYGEVRHTSGWDLLASLGHPCKFQRVSHLGSVTTRHLVVGVSQTLRRWTGGATCIRRGGHHVGHWPTFLVCSVILFLFWCMLTGTHIKTGQRNAAEVWHSALHSKPWSRHLSRHRRGASEDVC